MDFACRIRINTYRKGAGKKVYGRDFTPLIGDDLKRRGSRFFEALLIDQQH
jgi:hypothetical protein